MHRDKEWQELFTELSRLVLKKPGPSAYLSALYDEGSKEDLRKEVEKHKVCSLRPLTQRKEGP